MFSLSLPFPVPRLSQAGLHFQSQVGTEAKQLPGDSAPRQLALMELTRGLAGDSHGRSAEDIPCCGESSVPQAGTRE